MIGAKEVDREEPFERGVIAEVGLERYAGIVDEDIESADFLDGGPNLCCIGDVQHQRRNAPVGVRQGLARAGIDPFRASAQSLLDQRLSEAAIGSSHQNN